MRKEAQTTARAAGAFAGARALLLLNVALLAVLAAVVFSPGARAQIRPRGEYLMVSGSSNGSESDVVYIVDAVSQEMIALSYDHNTKSVVGIGYRNLAADAATLIRQGRN